MGREVGYISIYLSIYKKEGRIVLEGFGGEVFAGGWAEMGKARRRERKLLLWTSLLLLAVCLATGDAADLRTDQGTRKSESSQ